MIHDGDEVAFRPVIFGGKQSNFSSLVEQLSLLNVKFLQLKSFLAFSVNSVIKRPIFMTELREDNHRYMATNFHCPNPPPKGSAFSY